MLFNNLALTGWSFEHGDKRIPIEELDLPKHIIKRNPVSATYVYNDESTWEHRLQDHVRKVANQAGITGADIDAILGVHNGYNKHPEGASPVAMATYPESKAFMFDISLGCASVILGAQVAGLHLSDPSVNNILLATAQLITQYAKKCTDGNCLFADSMGAMMFSRSNTGNLVRYTDIHSEANFRDMFGVEENAIYSLQNLHKGPDLSKFMIKSYGEQLREACRAMNTYPVDIDYVVISASTYAASKMILDTMNIPLERSGLECLTKIPHMGTNDLIYQIEWGIEQGLINKGSKILVSGTSMGFSIATMAIEWGVQ